MNKSECPVCGSSHTIKHGKRNGVQTYVCKDSHYQFRNDKLPPDDEIWRLYQDNKQTVEELSSMLGTSASAIKRGLCKVKHEWVQPSLNGCGSVHIDATYWGRGWSVLLAIDNATGRPLCLSFYTHRRLRSAMHSLDFYLPYLFTCQEAGCEGMPNTNNKIEGTFTDLKKSLNRDFQLIPHLYFLKTVQYQILLRENRSRRRI